MTAFSLSERQADDILEIRLRQLARLEAIKIQQELAELRKEKATLQDLLDNPSSMKRLDHPRDRSRRQAVRRRRAAR